MTTLSADAMDDLRRHIREMVAAGFRPPDQIATDAAEVAADDAKCEPADVRVIAEQVTAEAFAAHRLEQAVWPPVTDCDRLDAAFAQLDTAGILARQNFSCCGTCGHGDMGEEIADAEDAGREVRGYTFYHVQTTEAAVEGCGVSLSYGAVADGESVALAVADQVVATLAAHGLRPRWDGTWRQCIHVPLDWKRRR